MLFLLKIVFKLTPRKLLLVEYILDSERSGSLAVILIFFIFIKHFFVIRKSDPTFSRSPFSGSSVENVPLTALGGVITTVLSNKCAQN